MKDQLMQCVFLVPLVSMPIPFVYKEFVAVKLGISPRTDCAVSLMLQMLYLFISCFQVEQVINVFL
jgi:hypothetical protein